MEDQSIFNSNQPKDGISENLQRYIDSLLEEIVLEGKPFDSQKKYLKKFSENEGLDYEALEKGIAELTETLMEMSSSDSKTLMRLALFQAKECYVSEAEVMRIVESLENQRNELADIVLFPAKQNGLYGYIDGNGNMVIKPQFEDAEEFFEGLAAVELNDKYGFIDKRGNMVIQPRFENISGFMHRGFSEGRAIVRLGKDNYNVIDRSGEIISKDTHYDCIILNYSEGLCPVIIGDRGCYIDTSGKMVIGPRFEVTREFTEGLAVVELDGKRGFIDKTGAIQITPRFYNAEPFSEGLSAVSKLEEKKGLFGRPKGVYIEGKYGYINKNGDTVIEHRYDKARPFHEGLASVKVDERWGFIDRMGNTVIAARYGYVSNFSEGLVAFAEDRLYGKQGYMDKTGHVVIEPRYDTAFEFNNGLARVEWGSKSAYIDHLGRIVYMES